MQGVCLGSGIGNFDEIFDTVVAYDKGVSHDSASRSRLVILTGHLRATKRSTRFLSLSY